MTMLWVGLGGGLLVFLLFAAAAMCDQRDSNRERWRREAEKMLRQGPKR